jgi:putative membrane protein
MASHRELIALLLGVLAVLGWSLVNPHDGVTWLMEAVPVLIAIPLLLATRNGFPLTRLTYYLIAFHAVILLVGAHYTYARVPIGNWVAEAMDWQRNHYDRFAHIVQGFVPAILAREILTRCDAVRSPNWLFFLVCCFCLAFSALYEIIEWQSAVWGGDGSLDFLGVQGDVWDAQWDMTLALFGSILAQWWLGGLHNRQLAALKS